MRRKRGSGNLWKDTAISSKAMVIPLQPKSIPWTQHYEFKEEPPYTVDLSFLQSRREIGEPLKNGFYQTVTFKHLKRQTIETYLKSVHYFWKYLDHLESNEQISTQRLQDLNKERIREFVYYLRDIEHIDSKLPEGPPVKKPLNPRNAVQHYNVIQTLLLEIQETNRQDLPFEIPPCPIRKTTGQHALKTNNTILSREQHLAILQAAGSEIKQLLNSYQPGDIPLGPQGFIPFLILLCAKLAGNPHSMLAMHRDCISKHPIDPDLYYVTWEKPRSGYPQRSLQESSSNELGVIELIQFIQKWTQPLAEFAKSHDQKLLFLYKARDNISQLNSKKYPEPRRLLPRLVNTELTKFIKRHHLLSFTLKQIRETEGVFLYLRSGNAVKVKHLLQHRKFDVTADYLRSNLAVVRSTQLITNGQQKAIESLVVVSNKSTQETLEELSLEPEVQQNIETGLYDAGGNYCKNPFHSPLPGQTQGKRCNAFHACALCPNAIYTVETLPQALIQRDRIATMSLQMPQDQWINLYGDILYTFDKHILPQFSSAQIQTARETTTKLISPPMMIEGVVQ